MFSHLLLSQITTAGAMHVPVFLQVFFCVVFAATLTFSVRQLASVPGEQWRPGAQSAMRSTSCIDVSLQVRIFAQQQQKALQIIFFLAKIFMPSLFKMESFAFVTADHCTAGALI